MDKNKITKPIILDETAKRQAVALETLAEKVGFLKGDKGDKGDTPIKGQDYYTEVDKAEIKDDVKTAVLGEIHIPTDNNELTNGAGYITSSSLPTKVSELTNDTGFITNSAIPTNISAFTNDSNYQTLTDVQGIIAEIAHFTISVVDALPETGAPMVLYLVPRAQNLQTETNIYDEYLWIAELSKYEHIGTTAADLSEYAKLADLSAVATSGAYSDLTGKPTIPTVNNPTITIQKNGTKVEDFTLNASTGKTINITVPTNTNELTNGAGFITSSSLPTKVSDLSNDSGYITSSALPTKVSDLTNDSNFITTNSVGKAILTIQKNGSQIAQFGANATSNVTANITVPTKVSDLTNDLTKETFTFVMEDGTTVTKQIYVG